MEIKTCSIFLLFTPLCSSSLSSPSLHLIFLFFFLHVPSLHLVFSYLPSAVFHFYPSHLVAFLHQCPDPYIEALWSYKWYWWQNVGDGKIAWRGRRNPLHAAHRYKSHMDDWLLTWIQLVRGFNLNHKIDDKIWCLKVRLQRVFVIFHRARMEYLETNAKTSCCF